MGIRESFVVNVDAMHRLYASITVDGDGNVPLDSFLAIAVIMADGSASMTIEPQESDNISASKSHNDRGRSYPDSSVNLNMNVDVHHSDGHHGGARTLKLPADAEEQLVRMFLEADVDGSGSLGLAEMIDLLQKVVPGISLQQCLAVIADLDRDHSGEI